MTVLRFSDVARPIAREALPTLFGDSLPAIVSQPQDPSWKLETITLKFGCPAHMMRNAQADHEAGRSEAVDTVQAELRRSATYAIIELSNSFEKQRVLALRHDLDSMIQHSGAADDDFWKLGECNYYVPIDFYTSR